MERFGPQKNWQSFCRRMVPYGMHPEMDIVMGRAPGFPSLGPGLQRATNYNSVNLAKINQDIVVVCLVRARQLSLR